MGKKSSPPPPPDFGPLVSAAREMSAQQYALQREQFAWAKQAYADQKVISDQVAQQMLEAQRFNMENVREGRQRWEEQFRPLEDEFLAKARDYASPERKELEMGRAQAAVAQQFDQARNAATRQLEGFGINPEAVRYAALDVGLRAQQAAAQAAAGNQAGMMTEAMGNKMLGEAINLGRGERVLSLNEQGMGNQSGAGAVNTGISTNTMGGNLMGTPTQYGTLAGNSLGMAGNMLGTQGRLALDTWRADQEADSGWGSALGLAGGLINSARSASGAAGIMAFLEEGGAVETPGGAIPMGASPSNGQTVDDVPARLTAGEFVVPKDVAAWKGEEFFQKLIEQSRKAKQTAPAKPETALMPAEQPAVASRPQGGALPLR